MCIRDRVWLGEADPLASRGDIEDADPVRRKLRDLLLVWWTTFHTAPSTTHELTLRANETHTTDTGDTAPSNPLLQETLATHFTDRRGDLSAKHIGDFLSRHERRTVCGARFEPDGFYGARKRWSIRVSDQATLDDELRKFLNLTERPS